MKKGKKGYSRVQQPIALLFKAPSDVRWKKKRKLWCNIHNIASQQLTRTDEGTENSLAIFT